MKTGNIIPVILVDSGMRSTAVCLLFSSIALLAQPANPPAFEVASVKAGERGQESIQPRPGSLTMQHTRLNVLIAWAYGVQDFQVSGPDWMAGQWFDVFAKSSGEATVPQLRAMVQTLLAERFKLAVHRDTKEMTVLVLTVAKTGHKLEPAEIEGAPNFQKGNLTATGRGSTLAPLLDLLSHELRVPIVDQTGLTGRYNFFFDINPYFSEESRKASAGLDGPPQDANAIIAVAFQKELGLKLEPKKASAELIVVDRVEKSPLEN